VRICATVKKENVRCDIVVKALVHTNVPMAIALMKSLGTRRPPVAMSVTCLAPTLSRYARARARAGIDGTEMWSRKMSGAAPVPPPRPSRTVALWFAFDCKICARRYAAAPK
jgi:hypothetical protein